MTHTVNDVTPHTPVVDDHVDDMITIFNIAGPMCYADEAGAQTGFDDPFTKIDICRAPYDSVDLGQRGPGRRRRRPVGSLVDRIQHMVPIRRLPEFTRRGARCAVMP
jgi:hypothetical protein